jgi:acyl-CoA thioester hydrolase
MIQRPTLDKRILFSDCDPFGHLYNARYIDYFLDAREEHVAANYPVLHAALQSRETNWVIVSNDVRYVSGAKLGEVVSIASAIVKHTRNSALLEITMRNCSGLKAMMWSLLRHVDLRRGIVVNHTEVIQQFLQDVCVPSGCTTVDQRLKEIQIENMSLNCASI